MIKKNRLGLLVLAISTAVLLSGCSQDAYSGFFSFMGGNVYSEDLGLTLPGESSAGAEAATENATTPTETTVDLGVADSGAAAAVDTGYDGDATHEEELDDDNLEEIFGETNKSTAKLVAISGKALTDDNALANVKAIIAKTPTEKKVVGYFDSEGAYKVPMFTPSTDAENKELEDLYSTKNAKAKAEISKMLKEEEKDPEKVLAAFNTLTSMENKIGNLKDNITGLTGSTQEQRDKFDSIADSLEIPVLPINPTKEDLVRVKLMLNVVNGLANAIKDQAGSVGALGGISKSTPSGELDVTKYNQILKNIKTLISAVSLNTDIGELVDKLDLASLISSLTEDGDNDSSELIDDLLNENSAFVKIILNDYLGIEKNTGDDNYTYVVSVSDAANLKIISEMIALSQQIVYLSDDKNVQNEFIANLSPSAKGLDGLITYSLAFVRNSIEKSYTGLREYYNANNGTEDDYTENAAFINAYLVDHSDEIYTIFDGNDATKVVFEDFTKNSAGGDDPIIAVFKDGEDFESAEILDAIFTYEDGKFVEVHNYFTNAISIMQSEKGVIYDALSDGLDGLVELEDGYTPAP